MLLLSLIGDDSLPVRVVVDEPLHEDEEREWLARIRWQLDVPDGRMLIMGGFDPDILQWWRDDHGPDDDGRGVAVARVSPGRWDLDVYTYVGSLNGNALLRQIDERRGAWFRRDHAGTPFPLWLAHALDYSGQEDPGHEDDWRRTKEAFAAGNLSIETETRGFIGLLVHLHKRAAHEPPDPEPDGGWFDPDAGARTLRRCPLGIVADVEDPDLVSFAQRITGTVPARREDPFIKGSRVDLAVTWPMQPDPLRDGPVRLALEHAWHAWAVAALGSEGVPAVEARVTNAGNWQPAENEWLFMERSASDVVIASPENFSGWGAWYNMSALSYALAGVPDGAAIDLMTDFAEIDENQPQDGRLRLSGKLAGGEWLIDDASPALSAAQWNDALAFIADLFQHQRIHAHTDAERQALEVSYQQWSDILGEDIVERDESGAHLNNSDVRSLVLIAQAVFRARFVQYWPPAAEFEF
ncbi:MAG: hypothetical protein ACRENP_07375 [Longimicrobiales bacterium]